MKKGCTLLVGLCLAAGLSAQQTKIPENYWTLFAANYEEYDSWWEVDDQTKNVQSLTGLTPKNGMKVSDISNNAYTITTDGDVFQIHYDKTDDYEKFQMSWMNWAYSACENDNWQLKNPITGEDWAEGADCHRTAKGYSVDFSDPANRIVYFKYQALGDASINLRVDLCDIKGRKSTKLGYVCTDALSKSSSYVPTDEEAWKEFMIAYTDETNEAAYEELGEYFDNSQFYQTTNVGLADGHNTWFNNIQFSSEPPSDFYFWLDSTRITGIELYINCDVKTAGQISDIYIKDLTIGNTLTRHNEEEFISEAIETVDGESAIEIVDGIVYSEGDIFIVNVLGQVVKSGKGQVSLDDLSNGVYFIKTAEGTAKFVK